MRSILKEFANGNIDPEYSSIRVSSEYSKAIGKIVDCESELMDAVPENNKDLVTAFVHAQGDLNILTGTDNFIYGYRLGVLMTMEVFNGIEDL